MDRLVARLMGMSTIPGGGLALLLQPGASPLHPLVDVAELPQRTIGPGLHSHAEGHCHMMKGKLPYLAEDNLVTTVVDGDI